MRTSKILSFLSILALALPATASPAPLQPQTLQPEPGVGESVAAIHNNLAPVEDTTTDPAIITTSIRKRSQKLPRHPQDEQTTTPLAGAVTSGLKMVQEAAAINSGGALIKEMLGGVS